MWGSYTAKGVSTYNVSGRIHGFKDLNNVFYNLDTDPNYRFTFKTTWNDKINDLNNPNAPQDNLSLRVDYKNSTKVQWVNPVFAEYNASYILNVTKDKIDKKTSHDIDVEYRYVQVSSKLNPNGSYNAGLYRQNYYAKSENELSVIYATWIQASKFTNSGLGDLKWVATDLKVDTLDLSKIKATNSYNEEMFGASVADLFNKKFIYPAGGEDGVVFSTDSLPTATSQINPYFKAINATGNVDGITKIGGPFIKVAANKAGSGHKGQFCVLVTQIDVQADAAPVDDHDEWLVLKFNDAFGFTENISAKVKIKKPTTTPARKR
jgi:hypothetical protein